MLSLVLASGTAAANNLVGWWQFDGDTQDYSGLGNDGTAIGNPTFVAGTVGSGALNFNGTDDYVSVPNSSSLQLTSALTIAGWIKADSWDSGNDVDPIARKGEGNPNNYQLAVVDGRATLYLDGGEADDDGFVGNTPLNTGQWYHIAATWDGLTVRIYVDGVIDNDPSDSRGNPIGTDTRPFYMGGRSGADLFDGALDDIRIYNRALSDTQAWDLFSGIDPVFVKAEDPVPADGAMYEDTWVSLSWSPGDLAVSHDVYLGDNFDDVNNGTGETFRGNQTSTLFFVGLGMPGDPYPGGLVPGTTYYWRIDEVNDADPNSPWKGDVWSFWIQPKKAYEPSVADGAKFVTTDVELSWSAGSGAKLHHVYFGDDLDTVTNATGAAAQTVATYTPGTLEEDKTYYWRVDEFEAPLTHKGDVWSFTTLPNVEITDPNLVGWWTFDEGQGATAVDWSGHGNHGTLENSPTVVDGQYVQALAFEGSRVVIPVSDSLTAELFQGSFTLAGWINPKRTGNTWQQIFRSVAANFNNDTLFLNNDGRLSWRGTVGGAWAGGMCETAADVVPADQWTHFAVVGDGTNFRIYVDRALSQESAFQTTDGSNATYYIGGTAGGESYSGIVDDVRLYDKALTVDEILLAMRGDLTRAWNASPPDNSTSDVVRAASVSWSPGDSVSQHAVYFGRDRDAVAGADTSDTTGVFRGFQASMSYTPPEGVEWAGGSYYWRVDEHNTDVTVTKGNVWTFLVADYILVDDFESYNDIPAGEPGSNLVYESWSDGFDNPSANGSTMGYVTGASMETSIVHGGRQSAPLGYNNTTAALSEVTRTFAPQNWTEHGVKTLGLWFHGAAGNTGQLYVKVNGSKVPYDGDAADLRRAWQAWNIELASFGANLQSVTSLAIGVEGSGAAGTLLLDDITLYALSREFITPVQPDLTGLVGHWALDGNVQDSSGLGNHGTAIGAPTYAIGKVGQAMSFDGTNDYVAIDGVADDITSNDITLAAWVKMTSDTDWYPIISCNTSGGDNVGWLAVDDGYADFGSLTGTMYVTDNNWHHLAYTRIADSGSLYVDGVLEGTHTPGFNFSTSNLWSIGQEWDGGPATSDFFIGTVDDARIYNYGLSYAEIAALAGRAQPFDKPF
jgi:hypothetical protein